MAFTTAEPSRPSQIGQIMWYQSKKHPDLPYPNIRFYNKETQQSSFLVEPKKNTTIRVTGVPRRFSVSQVEGFMDRETRSNQQGLFRGFLTLDSGPDEPLSVLVFDIFDKTAQRGDMTSMQLINSLASYSQMVQSGAASADTPIMISLYGKDKEGVRYPQSAVVRPSGVDENGRHVWADFKAGLVKSEEMVPRPTKVKDANGKDVMSNGRPVLDYADPVGFIEQKIGALLEHYGKHEATEDIAAAERDAASANEHFVEEGDGADVAGVIQETTGADRQRMSA